MTLAEAMRLWPVCPRPSVKRMVNPGKDCAKCVNKAQWLMVDKKTGKCLCLWRPRGQREMEKRK